MPTAEDKKRRSRLDGCELEIFKLVQKQATPKQWREWLRAPLEHAAANGDMDLFTRLMDAGADGSAGWRGCHGRTLLGAAARGQSEEMVLALLDAGAKPDVNVLYNDNSSGVGDDGVSALYMATLFGAEASAKALLIAGADPKISDSGAGLTPLHLAARDGRAALLQYLVSAGADPNARSTSSGYSPLQLAAHNGQLECVLRLLRAGADKNAVDLEGETSLIAAVRGNHIATVEKLLTAGADFNLRPNREARENDGDVEVEYTSLGTSSCLSLAARLGHVDLLKLLLQHGMKACDYGSTGDNDATPLHFAAGMEGPANNGKVVRVLYEAGADPEAMLTAAADGLTPLHVATTRRIASVGTIRALLDGGANVHVRDSSGQTPLHMACSRSSADAVEVLLLWGADETLADQNGGTPADVVGNWDPDCEEDEYRGLDDAECDARREQRVVDNERIRRKLGTAPADRSWRRRGWLVMCRSRPNRLQLSDDGGIGSGAGVVDRQDSAGSSSKVARTGDGIGGVGGGEGEKDAGDQLTVSFARLVERLVGMETENTFRLVVGFL